MPEDDESTSFDPVADFYDASAADMFADEVLTPTVDLLAELAGSGPALELGIGTGRVALPLAARGIPVSGIDASEKMVEKLREKPGGSDIPVVIGDFSKATVDGRFSLASSSSTRSGTCVLRRSRSPVSVTSPITLNPADASSWR
jgi:16S rRNA A1518/A1519 N6-dimethyltransferase RsmA/KsgA/DIM1 with predicted DNA glycosylase/AP lyase activity